jgi:hypothetical protein
MSDRRGKAQRPSLKITGEIQKFHCCRLRIGISSWRGQHKVELRDCSALIPDIYFPDANGVTIEISKLPELIEALRVAQTEAKKRGLLATAE